VKDLLDDLRRGDGIDPPFGCAPKHSLARISKRMLLSDRVHEHGSVEEDSHGKPSSGG
jgi:hypothetical protein